MASSQTLVEESTDPLAGLKVIDCDAHFTEPPDLWSSRVAAPQRERVPLQRTVDGITAWYLDDAVWAGIGGNTIKQGHQKVLGTHIVQPFTEVDPAAWDVKARLALMDEMGVWAQILYPNGIGFSSNHIFAIEDPAQRQVILQVYNDFLMDLQEESAGRLLPQAMLPIWDMDLTVSEMTRLLERGATGFTLSDRPELLGLPELPEPYFAPMWDLAHESGAAMNFHIGAGMRRERVKGPGEETLVRPAESAAAFAHLYWQSYGPQKRLALLATQMYMSNARIICNLCVSPLFDRYPRLKIVSAESGIGWIPFVLEALEYQLDEMVTDPAELDQQRRPKEYFRDH
ncbi:MAG: amidohydrolase family protein, partial [Acidimicrobiales bacterium]|nr:amidohydrolase family protein [Acidimicrobiales bacterium]